MDTLYNFFCKICILNSFWAKFNFQNTDFNEAVQIEGIRSISYITKEGPFVRAGDENVNEAEIFYV